MSIQKDTKIDKLTHKDEYWSANLDLSRHTGSELIFQRRSENLPDKIAVDSKIDRSGEFELPFQTGYSFAVAGDSDRIIGSHVWDYS